MTKLRELGEYNYRRFIIPTLVVGIGAILLTLYWDIPIAISAQSLAPYYKSAAEKVSLLGLAWPWLIFVLTMMVIFRKTFFYKGLSILLVYGLTGLVLATLKLVVGRYRPGQLFASGLYAINPLNLKYADCSFPSGHSQTIFAFMVAFAILYPKAKIYFWALAIAVAVSRIVVNYHYASDVLVGSYIGIVGALILTKVLLPQPDKAD